MKAPAEHRRWLAWSGLVIGPAAWATHHQLAYMNFWSCSRGSGALLIATGLAMLALALSGGALSFLAWRGHPTASTRRFIAGLGMMTSGLFALTLLVQVMAALILPSCFR